MVRLVLVLVCVAAFGLAWLAQTYRNQRDDLATAWLHFHPEDFPDLAAEMQKEDDA